MLKYFTNHKNKNPWHQLGVLTIIMTVWAILYTEVIFAALLTIVAVAAYLMAVNTLNNKIRLKKRKILKGLEEDSSDIIRNIFTNSENKKAEEDQFNNVIALLLKKYQRSEDIPFYFYVDSSSNNTAGIESFLSKAELVSIVDPGIDNKLKPCQCNIDQYFFDWWFTSKGVIVDLSSLLDSHDSEQMNAGLVKIESVIKFLTQFGKQAIKGMVYTVGADLLTSHDETLLARQLDQLRLISKTIARNITTPIDYNLLIQDSQYIEGFNEFLTCYSEAGHFSPIGLQVGGKGNEASLIDFVNSLNAFMLFLLQNNKSDLCNALGIGDFANNIDRLRAPILHIVESLSEGKGKSVCRGIHFISKDSVGSNFPDSESLNEQSKSAVLDKMLQNVTLSSNRRAGSFLSSLTALSFLIVGLGFLGYVFADNFSRIKSMKHVPHIDSGKTKKDGYIARLKGMYIYSISSQLPMLVSKKVPTPKPTDTNNLLEGKALHEFLLSIVYKNLGAGSDVSILKNSDKALRKYLQQPEKLVIPFRYTRKSYAFFPQALEDVLAVFIKRSQKVRTAKKLKDLEINALGKSIANLHINKHIDEWKNIFKLIRFKPIRDRLGAASLLRLLANQREFSISIRILADHHLPSFSSMSVKDFKDYLEKIDNSFDHSTLINQLAERIKQSNQDVASKNLLNKIIQLSQQNPLQNRYLKDVQAKILLVLGSSVSPITVARTGSESGETSPGSKVGETSQGPKVGETSPGSKVETSQGPKVGETSPGSKVETSPGSKVETSQGPKVSETSPGPKIGETNPEQCDPVTGDPLCTPKSSDFNAAEKRKQLIGEWNKKIYGYCARSISRRYPVSFTSRSNISIASFVRYFGSRGIVEKYYRNNLKDYTTRKGRRIRWNSKGLALKLGNRFLRQIQSVQAVRYAWFSRGRLSLVVHLKPESLTRTARRFELSLGRSYIEFNQDVKRYQRIRWSPYNRGWIARYVFIDHSNRQPVSERFPNSKWFWVRFMNRTIRGSNGLLTIRDGNYKALLHLQRTRSAVHQFSVVNNYRCMKL